MNPILSVAIKEFQDGLRNRWFISITLIFAVLSLGLSYYGSVASGQIGIASLSSTIASLSSLAVFLIPLIALLLAYDSFVGEQESGTLLLLLTYPISHRQLLLGKFTGQGAIIALATLIGFGSAAILLSTQSDPAAVFHSFGLFIATAILLGLSFISIAYVISLLVNEKSKAAGLALILWFFFILVFDLAMLAVLVGIEDGLSQQQLVQLMLFNPADIFRMVNLASLDTSDVNGVLAIAINGSISPMGLLGLQIAWIATPLSAAAIIFNRKTL
ncbi:ABC transporter permease [Parashewanella spongiae]|uniref:ABC transporter permease n=1 Tax=Parashewanella spongiae TaxID=342950 RepID=A0A3A6UHF9_9GAMM|nr:ABC transporter permease subunit [Parashewanella spongiae]MCL1077925.1 ABC transporter permease [Parashewanella spongiae]RJY18454.1 ABC transporter permease [Parashewanella spongiae]